MFCTLKAIPYYIFVLTKPGLRYIIRNLIAPGATEMTIKISDIPPQGLARELDQKLDLFDEGTASTIVIAVLNIKSSGSGLLRITGRAQASPQLQCSRCLKVFTQSVDTEINLELAPLNSFGTAAEHELIKGELDTEFYDGEEIDPVELVREQLLVALPMVSLHRPDCKGLCSTCGTDLNTAECNCKKNSPDALGAFSSLKDLLNK
jgi:uncharacterized metal-binding protein YceD (DUF177 family)